MKNDDLVLKIAGGILLAFLVIGIARAIYVRMVMKQFTDQMQAMTAEVTADSRRRQAQTAERARRQENERQADRQAKAAARALPPGHRCIGKDLFRRVDNGWVQINDGSEKLICAR
jgi:hypothetical protein